MKLAATDKRVTDSVVLRVIQREGIDPDGVEFSQDYAVRELGKGHGPYSKFYRNLNGRENWMAVSGLPMVTADNDLIDPGWRDAGQNYFTEKTNLIRARIHLRDVELVCKNDQPDGRKAGATLSYSPRLSLSGVEVPCTGPTLLPVDPWNANYQSNVLEWDYGICKRRLRSVQGRVRGYWIFPADPGGAVSIVYGQSGDYRLRLGPFAVSADEEYVPAAFFAAAIYPLAVGDEATYYPDANPETTSVDGWVRRDSVDETWATIIAGAGTNSSDSDTTTSLQFLASATNNQWARLIRGIVLFDTSNLPNNATISAGVLSRRGSSKIDNLSATPDINVYASTPALNISLQMSDYGQVGSTAFSTAITYADYLTTDYNDFTLNATGIAAISLISVSKFCFRNANYDVAGSAPPWSSGNVSALGGYNSEQGDGYKPKLVVTYTAPQVLNYTGATLIGLKPTATRVATVVKTAPVAKVGLKAIASRNETLVRASPIALVGLKAIASRALTLDRAATAAVDLKAVATRAWTAARSSTAKMGLKAVATRVAVLSRVSPVALLGLKAVATRAHVATRSATVAIGLKAAATRLVTLSRAGNAQLGLKPVAARAWASTRTAASVLGLKPVATRAWTLARTILAKVGLKPTATMVRPPYMTLTMKMPSRSLTMLMPSRSLTMKTRTEI